MKKIRWGILPVSGIFMERVFAPLKHSLDLQVVGIASRSMARAKSAAKTIGIEKAYGTYEALLQDREIDAVYISLPNSLHSEWIKKAIAAGKHVLCEKPLTMNGIEAAECVAFAKKHGVLLMESFMYKFHPQWQKAVGIVRNGGIGDVQSINVSFLYSNKDPNNIRNNLTLGGGALMDIGCYAISCARLVLQREPERVVSLSSRDPSFKTDSLFSGLLDFATARCAFTVGTQASFVQSVQVVGTEGTLIIEAPFNHAPEELCCISLSQEGRRIERLEEGPANQYGLVFEAFSKAIAEGRQAPVPSEDSIGNMKVVDALFKSEKTGNWEKT